MDTGMGEPLRLLLVEDSDIDAQLLAYDLSHANFEVKMQRVETEEGMRLALAQGTWDAIISDFRLPAFSAPDALAVLRESGLDLPFIIVSGTIGEETAVQIMRSGAHDYLMKSNLNRLAEALRREIREARVREERRQAEVALRESEEALRRQLKELTLLHAIAGMAIRAQTIDELVEFVTQEVGRTFYPDNFGFGFLDETEQFLRPHPSYRGLTENMPKLYPVNGCVSGSVVLSGKPRRIGDVTQVPEYLMTTAGIRSELCVPIKIGERAIGDINAESKQQDFFTEEDERLMLTIAGQMANAIERFRLFEAESTRRREAETLIEAISALSSSLELEKVLEIIMNSIEQVVPFDSASIFLLEGEFLRIMMHRGLPNPQQLLNKNFPANDPLFVETIRNGHLLILEDARQDPRFKQWGETSYVRGWMAIPLLARGEVIGYITLDSRKPAAYSQEHATLARAFANQAAVAIQNARLFERIQNSLRELNEAYETTIEGWSRALDLRDRETEGHTLRVTELTLKMAETMGFSEEERVHIRRGALLHDMGKLSVPDRILLKPDSLTDDEWEIMRMHPLYTYQMLAPIEYLRPALEIPLSHHERWDGSGYPRGLKGKEIPLVARIFAVIDVWDALTSDRPYRPAWSQRATLEYLKKNAGVLFDPEVIKLFLSLWDEGKIP